MLYCPRCDTEYVDGRKTCADDGTPLLDRRAYEAELARQGRLPRNSQFFREVGRGYDRFTAENVADAIAREGIESSIMPNRGATAGMLTEPVPRRSWIVVVAEDNAERAAAIARDAEQAIARSADEAGRAAEEEAAGSSAPPARE